MKKRTKWNEWDRMKDEWWQKRGEGTHIIEEKKIWRILYYTNKKQYTATIVVEKLFYTRIVCTRLLWKLWASWAIIQLLNISLRVYETVVVLILLLLNSNKIQIQCCNDDDDNDDDNNNSQTIVKHRKIIERNIYNTHAIYNNGKTSHCRTHIAIKILRWKSEWWHWRRRKQS